MQINATISETQKPHVFWTEQPVTAAQPYREWYCNCHLTLRVFCCTHYLGYQTLGEEYVNIVQVDSTKKRVPSFLRRAIFVSLHTVVPYCLEKGLLHLEHELQIAGDESRTSQSNPALGLSSRTLIRNWIQKQVGELTEQQKKTVLQIVYVLKQCIPLLHRLHLALFYISGTFYHLSKRITGITYVSGCISCLKLVSTAVFWPLLGCHVCKRDIEFAYSWFEYGQSWLGERDIFNTM